jgi:ABC transporter, phosphonate, periplasmic substrate-binding protein
MRHLRSLLIGAPLLAAILVQVPAMAAQPIHFLLIQPGSPGTTEEAAPLIGRLADYLAARLPKGTIVAGLYLNSIDQVTPAIKKDHPRFAIVTLPYYLEHRAAHDWRPQLATRPGGYTEEQYRLLVATGSHAATWRALDGDVAGTLCFTAEPVARLFFEESAASLPFRCRPTDRLLTAARRVIRGELSGLLVTEEQYASLMLLPERKQLRAVSTSPPLPTPLVVTFGPPDGPLNGIIQALLGMKDDPTAHDLLIELRTDGFGPVDQAALGRLQSAFEKPTGRTR